jgi:nucleotide-binding universal stress UspA family protein
MFKKILVAVDGSRHSSRAVDAAIDLAKCLPVSFVLLHVIRDLSLPKEILEMMARGEVTESRLELLQDSAEIILDNAREKLEAAGVSDVRSEIVMGDPAYGIADYAENNGVDLILIGFRGLNTRGDMLGSVVRKLLHVTKVSCLVVR